MTTWITAVLLLLRNFSSSSPLHAGGSNYGIVPGTVSNPAGKMQNWPVPTPRFDPKNQTFKEWDMPQGPRPHGDKSPYAVNTDGAGIVWVNEIDTYTVVRFDPKSEQIRVVTLPGNNSGIRKMTVDAQGRLWYMGSHNGRLGMVE